MKSMMAFLNKHRIRSLLFVLILVSLGSVTLTTKTRYVSYVSDYYAASAGEFYFGSNYLGESEDQVLYTISNWDKLKFSVTAQILNYENSLLYNGADVGFYYVVEGTVYTDADCTAESRNFGVTISYPDTVDTVEIDGVTYAYMPGTSEFDKTAGSNNVTVTAESTVSASGDQYLKVNAYTVPVLPGDTATQHSQGVFYSELEATFVLSDSTSTADVTSILKQSASNSEVQLRITCPEIPNATSQVLRVYYDTSVLEPDTKTLPSPQVYDSTYSYSDITVNSSSITTVLLFKTGGDTISLGDDSDWEHIYVQSGVADSDTTEDTTTDDTTT